MYMANNSSATVADVAKHFGVSQKTIRRLVARGEIPHRRIGESVRFDISEVERWASAGGLGDSANP
jgi:excisionase family DNA binding protein